MFGSLGGAEIILIFIVALIVFGPKRLPEIGRRLGGWIGEFRRATGEFRSNIEREIGFDPASGMESTKKVRREMLGAVSNPIRDITEETRRTIRDVRDQVKVIPARSITPSARPAAETSMGAKSKDSESRLENPSDSEDRPDPEIRSQPSDPPSGEEAAPSSPSNETQNRGPDHGGGPGA